MDTDKLFRVFDNDEVTNLYDLLTLSVKLYFSLINQKNNLVDSLEFLSSFAILSGMNPEEKIRCIYIYIYIFAKPNFNIIVKYNIKLFLRCMISMNLVCLH